jgi:hypothetical protein
LFSMKSTAASRVRRYRLRPKRNRGNRALSLLFCPGQQKRT